MADEPRDALRLLQHWYLAQCDGEWEHDYGITIGTLDNPGWTLKIDLRGTQLEGLSIDPHQANRSEHDWLFLSAKDDVFHAACGPTNLDEAILAFIDAAGARRAQ